MKIVCYLVSILLVFISFSCKSPEEKRKEKVEDAIEHTSEKVKKGSEKTLDFLEKKEKELKKTIED